MTVLFDHKVARVDWKRRIVYRAGKQGGWEEEQGEGGNDWDLCVGSDGIWSAVRGEMMKVSPCVGFLISSSDLIP